MTQQQLKCIMATNILVSQIGRSEKTNQVFLSPGMVDQSIAHAVWIASKIIAEVAAQDQAETNQSTETQLP